MEWDDLKYVLATARSGSFLGAAHLLKVTHTTVGRRIKALERDLGQPLFKRTRDGVEATDLCRRILPTAETIENQIRQIVLASEAEPAEPEGHVRVHTAAWIIEHLLIPELPRFHDQFPKVQVFFFIDVVEAVTDSTTPALSLRFEVMAKRSEVETRVADIPFSLYRMRGADDAHLKWATTHGVNVAMRTAGWLQDQGVSSKQISLFASDASSLRKAVETGHYKGLLPDYLAGQTGNLVRVNKGPPELIRRLRSITPRRSLAQPEVQAVLSWLTDTVRNSPAALR